MIGAGLAPPGRTMLLVSGMFPSPRAPYFGIHVRRFCEAARRRANYRYIEVVNRVPPGKGRPAAVVRNALLLARALGHGAVRRYDAVHGHYAFPAGWIAAAVARVCSKPLVLTCHGSDVAGLADRSATYRRRVRFALSRADLVIAVSRHVQAEIERCFGKDALPIAVISMGVDRTRFRPSAGARSRLGLPPAPAIFAAGNLVVEKGFAELIAAFALPPLSDVGARLYLAGAGPEARSLEHRVAVLGLGHAVRFLGPLDPDEVPVWLAAADLVAVPSRREGLGLVALEAMACGVPVVASRVGGLAETIEDGVNGSLVPPGDEVALARALRDLLDSPERRQRQIAAGLETAGRYDVVLEVDRMTDRIEQLLDARARR